MDSDKKLPTTRVSKGTLRAEWAVCNVEPLLTKEISSIKSPKLLACSMGSWTLTAELCVSSHSYTDYLHLTATARSTNHHSTEFPALIKAGFASSSGQPNLIELQECFLGSGHAELSKLWTGCTLNELKTAQNGIVCNNTLTVAFEITQWYFDYTYETQRPAVAKKVEDTPSNSSKDTAIIKCLSFLLSKQLTDFEIHVKEKVIPVHKIILAAATPVFAAMFTTNLKESRENRLDVADCTAEAVEAFINFIYSGQNEVEFSLAPELLAIAHKYQVNALSSLCEDLLIDQLNVEQAANTLVLSHLYHAEQLNETAQTYIVTNFKKIILTDGWKTLLERNTQVVNEVMQQLGATLPF